MNTRKHYLHDPEYRKIIDQRNENNDVVFYTKLGDYFFDRTIFIAAYKYYNNAIELDRQQKVNGAADGAVSDYDPRSAKLYFKRGYILSVLNKIPYAIGDFRVAVLRNPKYLKAHYHLARAYQEHGEIDQAISEYIKIKNLDPKSNLAKEIKMCLENIKSVYDISSLKKSDLFTAIKMLSHVDQITILKQSLLKHIPLGQRFWANESWWTECSLEKGTLKKIVARIHELELQQMPNVSIAQANTSLFKSKQLLDEDGNVPSNIKALHNSL